MLRKCLIGASLLAFAAASVLAGGLALDFANNGVRGFVSSTRGETILIVKASGCNVEALAVDIKFRREGQVDGDYRLAQQIARVMRCQIEPVSFHFRRADDERPYQISIRELVVANNASAPIPQLPE